MNSKLIFSSLQEDFAIEGISVDVNINEFIEVIFFSTGWRNFRYNFRYIQSSLFLKDVAKLKINDNAPIFNKTYKDRFISYTKSYFSSDGMFYDVHFMEFTKVLKLLSYQNFEPLRFITIKIVSVIILNAMDMFNEAVSELNGESIESNHKILELNSVIQTLTKNNLLPGLQDLEKVSYESVSLLLAMLKLNAVYVTTKLIPVLQMNDGNCFVMMSSFDHPKRVKVIIYKIYHFVLTSGQLSTEEVKKIYNLLRSSLEDGIYDSNVNILKLILESYTILSDSIKLNLRRNNEESLERLVYSDNHSVGQAAADYIIKCNKLFKSNIVGVKFIKCLVNFHSKTKIPTINALLESFYHHLIKNTSWNSWLQVILFHIDQNIAQMLQITLTIFTYYVKKSLATNNQSGVTKSLPNMVKNLMEYTTTFSPRISGIIEYCLQSNQPLALNYAIHTMQYYYQNISLPDLKNICHVLKQVWNFKSELTTYETAFILSKLLIKYSRNKLLNRDIRETIDYLIMDTIEKMESSYQDVILQIMAITQHFVLHKDVFDMIWNSYVNSMMESERDCTLNLFQSVKSFAVLYNMLKKSLNDLSWKVMYDDNSVDELVNHIRERLHLVIVSITLFISKPGFDEQLLYHSVDLMLSVLYCEALFTKDINEHSQFKLVDSALYLKLCSAIMECNVIILGLTSKKCNKMSFISCDENDCCYVLRKTCEIFQQKLLMRHYDFLPIIKLNLSNAHNTILFEYLFIFINNDTSNDFGNSRLLSDMIFIGLFQTYHESDSCDTAVDKMKEKFQR